MKIAIIVPFYNEEKNLIYFIKEWENFLKTKKELKNLFFFFINDGSTDLSINIINENAKSLKFKIINKNNTGHGATCKFGYKLIINNDQKFDYVLQIDSDNQCDPKYLTEFYNLAKKQNHDFIFGYRKYREDGYLRIFISRLLSIAIFIKKFTYIKDLNSPYRLMNIKELEKITTSIERKIKYNKIGLYNCLLTYEIQKKNKIKWININFRNRAFGKSNYNLFYLLKNFTNLILKI